MNNSKDMLKSIKLFLKRPNIKDTDDVVSFYYLYKETAKYIEKVNDISNNKNLANIINSSCSDTLKVNNVRIDLQGNLNDTSKILFEFSDYGGNNIISNNLCKDKNSDILYWEKSFPILNNDILLKHYNYIMNLFEFRDYFILSFFDKHCLSDVNNTYALTVKDNIFKATIDFDQRCHYSRYVGFDISEEELNAIDQDMNFRYYIAYKDFSIMKKIPIEINSLDDIFKNILNDNKKKKILKF